MLSPQRPRTVVAFDDRVFTTDSAGSRPVLTLFEHVEGSRVSEGLFQEYTLPNGRKVFMYCEGGAEGGGPWQAAGGAGGARARAERVRQLALWRGRLQHVV